MAIKIYTKTKHHKTTKGTYIPKMYGVIEGPVRFDDAISPYTFSNLLRHQKQKHQPEKQNKIKSDEQ